MRILFIQPSRLNPDGTVHHAESRCNHINIGMETVSAENLKVINKKQNHTDRYDLQFKEIRKRGIEYSLNVIMLDEHRVQSEFYSLPSIARRLFTPPRPYTPRALAANLFFKYGARRRIHPLAYY